ncbi:MAG TPA: hypothetical protein VHX38_18445 [Pseudonocardiaceae bacterium]|jgi:hypothetical protein|nr:hypothetical protein [Pseudonocardiaceae bacterium]
MDSEHVGFVIVGVIVVILVGQLLISAGRRYLANTAPNNGGAAASAATLLAVLFHLLTFGIVALIAALPIGGSTPEVFLIQAGILLIALAAVYGVALRMLGRQREEEIAADLETRPRSGEMEARLRVLPKVDYDNGEYGHSRYGSGIPRDVPMDPAAGTAMGQPNNESAL